ncbi:MAG TPA: hypothetical protein VGE07_28780, partial [Herpetosiphonaceae bacterium]
MARTLKPHQLRLEPNPPQRPAAVIVGRWGRDQWRLGGQKVRQRRATADGGMAWSVRRGEPAAWIVFSAEEWARIQDLPARIVKPQPPPAPIVDPARFTLHLSLQANGAAVSFRRLTDSLFIAEGMADGPRILLGFNPQPDGGALAHTSAGSFPLSAGEYRRLLALPAWKPSMTYARRKDRYARQMRELAWALALEQALPALVDGRPGDPALAARILRQLRVPPGACPVEWLARVPLPLPEFLRAAGPPAILDPLPGSPPDSPVPQPGLTLAEAVAGFTAAVRQQRAHAEATEQAAREAIRLAQERQAALERQRDAALRQIIAPELIETTLETLLYLNRWAKAADRLHRPDRQTLYAIKAMILREAWLAGQIRADGYLAGPFAPFADLDPLALGEGVGEALADPWSESPPAAQALARRLPATGDAALLGAAIGRRLAELEDAARASRLPIDAGELDALGLHPSDLPACQAAWDWADPRTRAVLDPEH